ncbi:hypothetical protein AALD22_19775 [Lachnospiraceae bacterium 56-18]
MSFDTRIRKLNGVSGTQNLFFLIFHQLPPHDIGTDNLPILMGLIEQLPETDRKRLIRYYGLGCPPTTLKALGEDEGFKSSSPIIRSIKKSRRFLQMNYYRTLMLLYTPHFEAFRECTELGNCPWREYCPLDLKDLARHPKDLEKYKISIKCKTFCDWWESILFEL